MNQLYETELMLLRAALWGEPAEVSPDTDWTALMKELQKQAVTGLVAGIDWPEGSIPEKIRQQLEQIRLRQGVAFYQYLDAEERVLELLRTNGIRTVVLKGIASAMQYPDPELRAMGDIDLLVAPGDYEKACDLMDYNGFCRGTASFKHTPFRRADCVVEIHRSFGNDIDLVSAPVLQNYMSNGLKNAVTKYCCGSAFPALPDLENGLVLLQHVADHLPSVLGLRQIIDWMMYVSGELRDGEKAKEFLATAEELHLSRLAVEMTAMCRKYLGLQCRMNWCEQAEEGVADRLMEEILSSGNWSKENHGSRTAQITNNVEHWLVHSDNSLDLLRQAQVSGLAHWKAVKRFPVLKPLAWVYGIGRAIHIGLGREDALGHLLQERRVAGEKKRLLDDLGVVR